MSEIKELIRCEIHNYSETYTPTLVYNRFKIISVTPCSFWIHRHGKYGPKKFVLKNPTNGGAKRFAYETKKEALDAIVHRRNRYTRILGIQIARNEKVLQLLEEIENGAYVHDPNQELPF